MKKVVICIVALLSCLVGGAQNFQRYNINYEDLGRYNPAAVAESERQLSLLAKYTGCPSAVYSEDPLDIAFDMATGRDKGKFMLGGMRDSYSFFERYFAYIGYAWKIQLGTGFINVGARVNLAADRVDMTSLASFDGGRESLAFIGEDWDLGLEYRKRGLHFGFAVQNIMASKSEWEEIAFLRNPRTFVCNLSYDFKTRGGGFQFSPFVLAGYSQTIMLDAGAFMSFGRVVNLGYSFRPFEMRHVASCRIPVPGTSFALRGGYSWSMTRCDRAISAGLVYLM